MLPPVFRSRMRRAAFTLVEALVATGASVVLGSIIYTAASEALVSFARNISINRGYSDARIALDRIAQTIETAAHTPVLIGPDGLTYPTTADLTAHSNHAQGIRFYRYDSTPCYPISGGTSDDTKLQITVPTGADKVTVGDYISVAAIGFEGLVTAVSTDGKSLTFGGSKISAGCVPALSSTVNFTPAVATVGNAAVSYSCLDFQQVLFLAYGTDLRYYPRAPAVAADVTNKANYKVIARLVAAGTVTQQLPFELALDSNAKQTPLIKITLCTEGPDYNNRKLGTANTFTQFQTCLGSRCPLMLRGPF